MMNPYGYGYGGYGWGAGLLMGLFGLIILIGVVLLIVWAVRAGEHQHQGTYYGQHPGQQQGRYGEQWQPTQPGVMHPGGQGGQQRDPAVDAARERYARGEISKEQYDEILRHLGYHVPPSQTPPQTPPQSPPPASS